MKKLEKSICVIGGGSTYTPELFDGMLSRASELGIKHVTLQDIDASRLYIVGIFCDRMRRAAGAEFDLTLTQNIDEALRGADFVFTQIRVGGQQARILDEKTGKKFDLIGQETTGEGGFAKAMRTVPVILDICRKMEELAPSAWMINFTNPSGIVTESILRRSSVKCIGLCNVPINLSIDIAKFLGLPLERVFVDYVGLNHLAWIRRVLVDGKDLMPGLFDKSIKDLQPKNIPDMDYPSSLLRALRMLPAYYNRYYYMTETLIAKQAKKKKTRGEEVLEIENRLIEIYANPKIDKKPAMLSKRGGAFYSKAALDVASAIINNTGNIQVVNVQNKGSIENFYNDAVVEIPCAIGLKGAKPLPIGKVEPHILGIMHHVKAYERLTIDAAVTMRYDDALLALLTHPLCGGAEKASKVLDELNRVHRLGLIK